MADARTPWLFAEPSKPRRKRCIVCNELTYNNLWKTYYLPKKKKYYDGIHCEKCAETQDKKWREEIEEWQNHTESEESGA